MNYDLMGNETSCSSSRIQSTLEDVTSNNLRRLQITERIYNDIDYKLQWKKQIKFLVFAHHLSIKTLLPSSSS